MDRRLALAALGMLSLVLLTFAALSLQWRIQHDVPIFVYLSWLIDREGFVPYRDLFDCNMPGTYLAHILLARLFGYGDVGMRVADLLLLATLGAITWAIMRRFAGRCGWFSGLAFALWYLHGGPMIALLGLVPTYALYTLAGGKFWPYHTIPFVYAAMLAGGLCLLPLTGASHAAAGEGRRPDRARWLGRQLPGLLAIAVLAMQNAPPPFLLAQLRGTPLRAPTGGTPDKVAAFLRAHLHPGDRVQPLDWTGGAVHGLLEARAVLATPYVYDLQFYHGLSTPYVQHLRADFLQRLAAHPPRFVIDVLNKPRVWGADCSREFPALFAWLERNYTVVVSDRRYRIFERRAPDGKRDAPS